ncbi:hypothetical protein DXG03_007937 [Asterophora parasitica]|uniref:Uncharacterized protein n=1 Tax=Asterophora parasitica TaxID=117018 RepID=A0A9P7KD01_9AGAR|nr:hypothetical protein DXG03_007937 [Asterophora parasitica]
MQAHTYAPHPPHPQAPPPASYSAAQRPDPTDAFVNKLITALVPVLSAQNKSVSARIGALETGLDEKLAGHVHALKDDAASRTKELAEAMSKAHSMQQAVTKALGSRVEKLEKDIASAFNRKDNSSLASRLDAILFTVEELSERAKDPQAIVPDQPETVLVTTPKQYADAAIETETAPVIAVEQPIYSEVSVGSNSPIPKTPRRNPEPTTRSFAVGPMRQAYFRIGTDVQTPLPPKPPPQYKSFGAATSPPTDLLRLSMTSSGRYSSEGMTIAYPEMKAVVEGVVSIIPRLEPNRIEAAHSEAEDEDEEEDELEYPLSPGNDGSVQRLSLDEDNLEYPGSPGHDDVQMRSLGEDDVGYPGSPGNITGVQMRSLFSSFPTISRSLSAADWSDEERHTEEDSELPVFHPDTLPSIAKQYSAISNERDSSSDGTVASLRHDALGDAHAGPRSSSPQPPILPFHPRPSVSPLPSPASSPSPSPVPTPRRKAPPKIVSSPIEDDEELSSAGLVSSALREVSSPMKEQTKLAAPTLDSTYAAPVSSPEYEPPSPVRATSISSPAPVTQSQSQPQSQAVRRDARPEENNVIPDSEDESELSVTRLITQTFENLEELQPEAEAGSAEHVPLFLPSLSQEDSPPTTPVRSPKKIKRVVSSRSSSDSHYSFAANPKPTGTVSPIKRILSSGTNVPGSIKKPSLSQSQFKVTTNTSTTSTPIVPIVASPSPKPQPSSASTNSFTPAAAPRPKPRPSSSSTNSFAPTVSAVSVPPPKPQPSSSSTNSFTPTTTSAATRPRPRPVPKKVWAPSSPIYISSRSPSPLSDLSESESESGSDSDSDDVHIVPVKKTTLVTTNNAKAKVAPAPASTFASAGKAPRINLKDKILKLTDASRNDTSAAVTRVKKRKIKVPTSLEAMEPPLKHARQRVDDSAHAYGESSMREKKKAVSSGNGKEREREETRRRKEKSSTESGKCVSERVRQKAPSQTCEWPPKNVTSDKKFNQLECTWEEEDGMSDPLSFIQRFNEAALKEGVNPEVDQHSTILLREAIKGGWKDPNA